MLPSARCIALFVHESRRLRFLYAPGSQTMLFGLLVWTFNWLVGWSVGRFVGLSVCNPSSKAKSANTNSTLADE